MHVDEVVEAVDDAVHEGVRVRLRGGAVLLAGHEPVEVGVVQVAALRAQKARDVGHGDGDDDAAQLVALDLAKQAVDQRDAVQLVAVQAGGDAERRPDALALRWCGEPGERDRRGVRIGQATGCARAQRACGPRRVLLAATCLGHEHGHFDVLAEAVAREDDPQAADLPDRQHVQLELLDSRELRHRQRHGRRAHRLVLLGHARRILQHRLEAPHARMHARL